MRIAQMIESTQAYLIVSLLCHVHMFAVTMICRIIFMRSWTTTYRLSISRAIWARTRSGEESRVRRVSPICLAWLRAKWVDKWVTRSRTRGFCSLCEINYLLRSLVRFSFISRNSVVSSYIITCIFPVVVLFTISYFLCHVSQHKIIISRKKIFLPHAHRSVSAAFICDIAYVVFFF